MEPTKGKTATPAPAANGAPAAKSKKGPQTDAEKKAKLKELAGPRVTRVTAALKRVGQLGRYKPTGPQADAIVSALKKAFDNAAAQLRGGTVVSDFELPSE